MKAQAASDQAKSTHVVAHWCGGVAACQVLVRIHDLEGLHHFLPHLQPLVVVLCAKYCGKAANKTNSGQDSSSVETGGV